MRNFITLLEDAKSFTDCLLDAITAAQEYGFYWEEKGCWGMALALFDKFTELGEEPQLVVCNETGGVQAMVRVGRDLYDWHGVIKWEGGPTIDCDEEKLIRIAEENGFSKEDIDADKEEAAGLIVNAEELCN